MTPFFKYPKLRRHSSLHYRCVFFILCFIAGNGLFAQIPHIEIKNHRAETATYGQIDLCDENKVKKSSKFIIQLPTVDTFTVQKIATDLTDSLALDDTLDILIYIHAMWGGVELFENMILGTFAPELLSPQGSIDKILPITWHSGANYASNLRKASKIGESLGINVGNIMSSVREKSEQPVRFHLLCHSMGHQVFRGIYKVNTTNDDFYFEEVIFAAPDIKADIFADEWQNFSKKVDRLSYFVNKKDGALTFSEKRIKLKRLGKSGSTVPTPSNIQKIDVTDISDTKRLLSKKPGHGYFFASPTVKEMIIRLLNDHRMNTLK